MSGRSLFASTVQFPDVARAGNTVSVTVQDEEMLIRKMPKPTSAVRCSLPTRLVMRGGRLHAVVRQLDVSGAVLFVEHAIPDQAHAWLPLVLPRGQAQIPARVVRTVQREPGACWIAELKFELADNDTRSGVAKLITALRLLESRKREREDGSTRRD